MKTLKKYSLLSLFVLLTATLSFAQSGEETDEDNKILQRLVFGGNVGGGYANGWNINVSPTVGYRLTNTTIAGAGVTYIYSDFRNTWTGLRSTFNVTGGRLFAQQLLFQNLYARAEYEYLYFEVKERASDGRVLRTFESQAPGILLGGGYTSRFGRGLGFTVEALYNVIYRADTSPYPSPLIIRGGFMVGF